MKLATFAIFAQVAAYSLVAGAYKITGDSVNCRSGPGTSYGSKRTYKKGEEVSISCQTEGTNVNGNSIWDKTDDGCYVADYYVKTGTSGYLSNKPKCSSGSGGGSSGGGKIPGPVINDYPYKNQCAGFVAEKWNYFKCQCTSFVAWRINERLGINFHNRYKGQEWGHAEQWDEAARKSGVVVNDKPVPGCVAQTNRQPKGHVAWVTKVSGNSVTIEEYNWNTPKGYGTRTVPKSTFNYIHVKV